MTASRTGIKPLLVLAILLLAGLALLAWKVMNHKDATAGREGPRVTPVAVATVKPHLFVEQIEALGTAGSNESVEISAKVTDTVSKIRFEDGAVVEAGSILAELTNVEESAGLASADAALSEARKSFQRAEDLLNKGTGTKARFDQAQAALRAAAANKEAIEARLADRLIKAPFTGIVGLRTVSQGTLVRPGDIITTLDDISLIKLDFTVPETYLGGLAVGQTIRAKSEAFPDIDFEGEISALGTRVDPATRAITVRALISNKDLRLRPGMLLRVAVIRSRQEAPAVPERALVSFADRVFVFPVRDGVAARSEVTIGRRYEGFAEILSGVSLGEEVVVDGTHKVQPGAQLMIIERDGTPVAAGGLPPASGS